MRDEVADLITELSTTVLGVQPDPNIRAKIEAKRATKGVKAQMAKLTAREQALATERQAIAERDQRTQTERMLHQEISNPEIAKQHPYLALEEEAGGMIYDVVESKFKRDLAAGNANPVAMPWKDAAKQIDDYLKTKWGAAYDKRSHLFAPKAPPANGSNGQRPQGDPQGIRRSHTLTNQAAAQTTLPPPAEPPLMRNGRMDVESRRQATKQKMRAAFGRSDE
jgi:hypothetical protein